MARLGADHRVISATQQRLYRAFAKTGQKLTWDAIEKIETDALVSGGFKPATAEATVKRAISALKDRGVTGPTRTPWGN